MSTSTTIEWTGATWNPIRAVTKHAAAGNQRWGYHCEHVSEGCRNCYAERMNGRMLPAWGTGLEYTRQNREKVEIDLDRQALMQPLRWKKGRKIFPCSMTDLFAEFVPDEMIDRVFAVMALTPQHTYQVLTKRAARMLRWAESKHGHLAVEYQHFPAMSVSRLLPLPNVWMGVSVEDQRTADERVPLLLRTPAALRWVSYEPALGPVDWDRCYQPHDESNGLCDHEEIGIDWIVVGGESGPGARPFDVAWARQTISQCQEAGVPVFVKQLGAKPWEEIIVPRDGHRWKRSLVLQNRKGGDPSEWPENLRVRQYPEASR
mgnify:FL=1